MSEYKTCTITIVEPGLPDAVIKVWPAEHETEKIWKDTRPGVERWLKVEQIMKRYCRKGSFVPPPAYWHTPGAKQEEVNVVILRPEDIPLVELDGAVLDAPPQKQHIKMPVPANAVVQASEVAALKQELAELRSMMAKSFAKEQPAPAKPEVDSSGDELTGDPVADMVAAARSGATLREHQEAIEQATAPVKRGRGRPRKEG